MKKKVELTKKQKANLTNHGGYVPRYCKICGKEEGKFGCPDWDKHYLELEKRKNKKKGAVGK